MDPIRQRQLELRADIIKALAHPSRLLIVEELAKGERCVCELQAMVEADMSTVSKHLALLRQAGIVSTDKRGKSVYYTLKTPCILNFIGCVERVIATNVRDQQQALTT